MGPSSRVIRVHTSIPESPGDLRRAAARVRDFWLSEEVAGFRVVAEGSAEFELVVREPAALPARGGLQRAFDVLLSSSEDAQVVPAGAWPGGPGLPLPCVTAWEMDALPSVSGDTSGLGADSAPVILRRTGAAGRSVAAPGFFVYSFSGRKSHERPDVARMLPQGVRSVLDVGCGEGAFGATLERSGVRVTGIEHDVSAAAVAASRLSRVFASPVEEVLAELGDAPDVFVLADVLEHLDDPVAVLAALSDRARPATRLLVSVPNAGHASVLGGMLQGRFDPALEGIVAEDHRTYADRRGYELLLRAGGWEIEAEDAVRMLPDTAQPWAAALRSVLPENSVHGLEVVQWLFRAKPRRRTPLPSPTFDQGAAGTLFDRDDPSEALATAGNLEVALPNAVSGDALEGFFRAGIFPGAGLSRAHTEIGLLRRFAPRFGLTIEREAGSIEGFLAKTVESAVRAGLPVHRRALESKMLRILIPPRDRQR